MTIINKIKNILIIKGWNFRRILYLIGGFWMVALSVKDQEWWMSIFGLYFIAMSIFKFGCASGNCEIPKK
ncbi:hypothetical protein [Amniculibacterium sp. G2-70]|jgi:hypothetical protein|uniref:hypothetical protein n=1 Tax=Amniculibacterium sp. G2-70 TaxID=2767188 RepID=UPI0016541A26|nr:hypothetical protein [Amniculibacterium sp. G2-70]